MKQFMVVGQHIQFASPGDSPFNKPKPVVLGTYPCENTDQAFELFLEEYTQGDVKKAQMFYNDIVVFEVNAAGRVYHLTDTFGEVAKFPNPHLYQDGF